MKIPIVNEQDEIIGYKEREDATTDDLVRASGLWVSDKDRNILLAQRAFSKKYAPGLWGSAAGGVVEENETYESCIVREAEEEIGLKGVIFKLGPKICLPDCFVQYFSAIVDRDYVFIKQEEEVEQIKWFSQVELDEFLKEKPEMFMNGFKEYIKLFKINENQN